MCSTTIRLLFLDAVAVLAVGLTSQSELHFHGVQIPTSEQIDPSIVTLVYYVIESILKRIRLFH